MSKLKEIIQDLINERPEQAKASIHEYFVEKTKELREAEKPFRGTSGKGSEIIKLENGKYAIYKKEVDRYFDFDTATWVSSSKIDGDWTGIAFKTKAEVRDALDDPKSFFEEVEGDQTDAAISAIQAAVKFLTAGGDRNLHDADLDEDDVLRISITNMEAGEIRTQDILSKVKPYFKVKVSYSDEDESPFGAGADWEFTFDDKKIDGNKLLKAVNK